MPTTPRDLVYPDSGGSTEIWEHFETLAESTDTAIGVAEAAALDAAQDEIRESIADPSGLAGVDDLYPGKRVWVESLAAHFVYTGADWILPVQSGNDLIATAAAAVRSVVVVFPYEFDVPPRVTVDAVTDSPNLVAMSHEAPTTTSVRVYMYRVSGAGNVHFEWHAIAQTV